jgi:hypothetical protein
MDRSADNHYSTSVTNVIKSRNIASIAADDCVLFLWATVPMLLRPDGWGWDIVTADGCFISRPEIDFASAGWATAADAMVEGLRVARWLSETRL